MQDSEAMKFESDSSDRLSSIYELAKIWFKYGVCCDVTVTCVDENGKFDFKCHKLMIFPLFSQVYALNSSRNFEDIEHVILPDVKPCSFKQFLHYVYGLENSQPSFSDIFVTNDENSLLLGTTVKIENEDTDYEGDFSKQLNKEMIKEKINYLQEEKRRWVKRESYLDKDDTDLKPLISPSDFVKISLQDDDAVVEFKRKQWHPCTLCSESLPSKEQRIHHMLKVHYDELQKQDRIYTKVNKHKRLKTAIKWINCEIDSCDKWFKDNAEKESHNVRAHAGAKNHICEVCSQAFSKKSLLTQHINMKHSTTDEQIMCNECGEYFGNNTKLKYHQQLAHRRTENSYSCRFCDYKTTWKAQLVSHERSHTGEKPEDNIQIEV